MPFRINSESRFADRTKLVGEQPAFNAQQLFDTPINPKLEFTVNAGDVLIWDESLEKWVSGSTLGTTGSTGSTGSISGTISPFIPAAGRVIFGPTGGNFSVRYGNTVVVNLALETVIPITGPLSVNLGSFGEHPILGNPPLSISTPLTQGAFLMTATIFNLDGSIRLVPASTTTIPAGYILSFQGMYSLV
jgi:hypothetical protein